MGGGILRQKQLELRRSIIERTFWGRIKPDGSCLQLGGKDTSLRALGFVGSRIFNSKRSRIPKPDDMIKNCSEVVWYIKKFPDVCRGQWQEPSIPKIQQVLGNTGGAGVFQIDRTFNRDGTSQIESNISSIQDPNWGQQRCWRRQWHPYLFRVLRMCFWMRGWVHVFKPNTSPEVS